jgi:hypothetical protein
MRTKPLAILFVARPRLKSDPRAAITVSTTMGNTVNDLMLFGAAAAVVFFVVRWSKYFRWPGDCR